MSPLDPAHPSYTGHGGALRDSGTVKEPVVRGSVVTVELGDNADYAAAVHERLDQHRQYSGAVNPRAQAEFLETAIRDSAGRFLPHVRERVNEALR